MEIKYTQQEMVNHLMWMEEEFYRNYSKDYPEHTKECWLKKM